jgi:D-arabinose 1-dehydrogenase-like Zn-dependent alcohol dehydrogenase
VGTLLAIVMLILFSFFAGDARDSEDTLKFAALTGVRPMIELYPLEKANEALQRMLSNQARFRVVLQIK